MKKLSMLLLAGTITLVAVAQQDTLSENIYQYNGNLGIGVEYPSHKIEITDHFDNGAERYMIKLHNTSLSAYSTAGIQLKAGENGAVGNLNFTSETYNDPLQEDAGDRLNLGTNGKSIGLLVNQPDGYIRFATGGESGVHTAFERMRITGQGNVGIGTAEPVEMLDVNGGIRLGNSLAENAGTLRWSGVDFEGYTGFEWVSLSANPTYMEHPNVFFTNNRVGIGNSTPEHLIDITADAGQYDSHPRQFINLVNTNNSMHSNVALSMMSGTDDNTAHASFGVTAYSYLANPDISGYAYMYSPAAGIKLRAVGESADIGFVVGGQGEDYERMRISSEGNVGIGTSEPVARLQVTDGDIFISDIDKGIIMKSPDGQCWRGTLNNSGDLSFILIDCPPADLPSLNKGNTNDPGQITVFPNPTNDIIIVETENTLSEKLKYNIYTLDGRLLESGKIKSGLDQISLRSLYDGLYLLQVQDINGKQIARQQIVKQ